MKAAPSCPRCRKETYGPCTCHAYCGASACGTTGRRGCTKRRFLSKAAAIAAMRKVPVQRDGQMPMRAYRCGKCKAWHFSSKQWRA